MLVRPRFTSLALLALFASACGGGSPDGSGFVVLDARPVLDFGPLDPDSGEPPADSGQPNDAGFLDAAPVDTGAPDSGVVPDGGMDAGVPDSGPTGQTGALIITELSALGAVDWIELHNPGAAAIELTEYSFEVGSSGTLVIRAAADPAGTGTPAPLAPGGYAYGVANPTLASEIPNDAAFVLGEVGAHVGGFLGDGGDEVSVTHALGVADRVDFRGAVTSTSVLLTANDFILVREAPLALDPTSLDARANDSGGVWCAQVFRGATPGAANHSCRTIVISEVLYDYDSISSGADQGREFVELAGPAGAPLAGVVLTAVEGSGAAAGTVDRTVAINQVRMPLDGLYVIADQETAGVTYVPNADQIVNLDLENAALDGSEGDALQLIREMPGSPPVLLDAFGYGTLAPGLVDATRSFAVFEGTPVVDLRPDVHSANWARSDDEVDTDDNVADFRHDPTPTPGARNGGDQFGVSALSPNNALLTASTSMRVIGRDFTDGMTVSVGGVNLTACTYATEDELVCTVPAGGSGVRRVDVTVAAIAAHGGTVTLTSAFTYTAPVNESDGMIEADFVNLQFPATLSVAAGQASAPIFGRIYEAGLTDTTTGMMAPGILADVGYGPSGSNPTTSNAWRWSPAIFNVEVPGNPNDDEYMGTLTIPTAGTYAYTFRFSLDGGLTFTYADLDGAGSGAGLVFSAANLGVATVTP